MHGETFDHSIIDKKANKNSGKEATNVQMHGEIFDHSIEDKKAKTNSGREVTSDQMHGEAFDHSIKDKEAKKVSKTTDHRQIKESSCDSGSSSDLEGQIDVINRDEHGKNNQSDTHINRTKSMPSSTRRTSSSSSSESSLDNFFTMEEAFKYTNSGKSYVSSSGSSKKSEVDNSLQIPTSTTQVYNLSHSQKDMSPTASPRNQTMDRSERYDASVIPSSIFESTTNPSEWSIASNDSLFSIQIGQPSFTRENALLYAAELSLPEELTKSGELNNQAPSVIPEEIVTAMKSVDVENLQTIETSYGSFKLEGERLSEDKNEMKTSHQTTSYKSSKSNVSILSHSSDTGMGATILPVKKRTRKLAYFYNCRWVFCHLWSSCESSNCCRGFSCCWNYNHKKQRHRASPILTEPERNDSMKMDTPRQQSNKQESEMTGESSTSSCSCFQSTQESEVTSNSTCCNWFHCFSCPSYCFSCTSCNCCC